MAVCWLEGGQVSACNKPVCGLDTWDLHLELWSGEQFSMTAGALSWLSHANDCKFVRQSECRHVALACLITRSFSNRARMGHHWIPTPAASTNSINHPCTYQPSATAMELHLSN
ncbi:hypothetical protein AVEN_179242-1 [Araneus ventricosus]|uniref:Uncharacterized protein n=1 Tax=Araneus ventricosus TaxID=182803 RepID=A0A4Y2C9U8_ARAVE|nr:hypothetical protein AVEN_179242-1 [Araneus ventricosus]